jgi:hypothetical protein
MGHGISRIGATLCALTAAAAVVLWSATSFAGPPAVGPDCGSGAAIVGSDSAGKVTLGADPGNCTITFSTPYLNPPACMATNETNGGGHAVSVGVRTTTASISMDSMYVMYQGDVISYMCVEY